MTFSQITAYFLIAIVIKLGSRENITENFSLIEETVGEIYYPPNSVRNIGRPQRSFISLL
jgi:hypothetical protein